MWQREVKGYTVKRVASNLGVDAATVSRIVNRFRLSGVVQRMPHNHISYSLLTEPIKLMILHLVLQRPGMYLHEIASAVLEDTGANLPLSSICRFLRRMRFTQQKLRLVAKQRDEYKRALFVSEVSVYKPDMLIFLDESGSDRRACIRRYGYSLQGKPLVHEKLLVRGKRVSAIGLMSMNGMLDCKVVTGTVNSEVFYNFVETALLPQLMPFNGSNPHSVVVMDNCSIHHVHRIVKMIHEVGALVHFLPPYSPDYNPIEEGFSKVKACLKLMDEEADYMFDDHESLVLSAFSLLTVKDCQKWIYNAGIYTVS